MTKKTICRFLATLVLALGTGLAGAEDIDIYSQNTSITPAAPNVLIVMDNTANWSQSFGGSTKFAAELTALSTVVSALKADFNLGLMMFTETGSPNSNTDGGYVRFAIQAMSDSGNATAARNCLLKMVGANTTCTSSNTYYSLLDINNDKSNGGKAGVTMGEVYDYFAGLNAYAGNNKVKADPLAFTSGTTAGPTYKSPVAANSCQKNFVIVISNGPFSDNSSDTSTAMSQLGTAGGDTTVINPPDTTNNNNAGDEWTRFLNKVSTVNAVTYTLEVGPSTTGQGPYNTALLQSMGRQGKGGYYSAIDAATLLAALTRIFNDIQATNSVFASSSLPLSADNSGAFSDQVYMGVFRPDGQGQPRWVGNLKQYKFAVDANGNLSVVDANNVAAAGASGFAQPDAVSFWTSPLKPYYVAPVTTPTTAPDMAFVAATDATTGSTGGFWYFDSKGSGGPYDSADGEWVEKGGAAQQLRLAYLGYGGRGGIGDTNTSKLNSLPARQVYTCTGSCAAGSALSGTPFDTTNTDITNALLGTAEATVSSITSAASKSVSALSAGTSVAIVSADESTGIVTTAGHSFVVGDTVTIAGNSTNGINGGPYTITAVTSLTFTITGLKGNSTGTGGTATKPTTTATATSAAHGFVVGQRITIAGATPSTFNGVVLVATVPNANTFTYTLGSALGQSAGGTITATSNTATATAAAHGFTTGQSVTIAGATPTGYNGVWIVTVVDANTFTYVYTVAAPLASASGTITASIGGGRTTLIKWVRGQDTQNENGFKVNGADTDVRASIHGDVLHTRPVVLNYGVTGSTDNVYVFYGGNDGVFRAVKGGQATTDGNEQWAFIPQEFFGKFKRLYDNSPMVLYPSTPSGLTPTPTKRDYSWDGPVGSYVERDSGGAVSKAYLYIAARRGGRFIYALDVTSQTNPKLLWKKGCPNPYPNNTGCDPGFAELGQTWSLPQAIRVKANTNPVLIFGGGYDPTSEDPEPPAASDSVGRAVYVLDAFTGAPLWTAGQATGAATTLAVSGMTFSIAADVLTMDRTQDGFADRVYAADIGGNIWRLDIDDASMSNWKVWKIAAVADRSATASTRKFLFAPDVVFGDAFDAVVIGSGDREHPLSTNAAENVVNRAYMFVDPNIGTTGADLGITDTCGATVSTSCSNLFDATNSSLVPSTAKGWLITLATGEKVVNGPIVPPGGVMYFGTNQPCASGKVDANGNCATSGTLSCTGNLGIARRYSIDYLTGAADGFTNTSGTAVRSEVAAGGGFLPSPVDGIVEINGSRYMFVTDNPLNPGGVTTPKITAPTKRFRTWWREILE